MTKRSQASIRTEMAKEIAAGLAKAMTGRVDVTMPNAKRLDELSAELRDVKEGRR